jgi:hypothetical protein
MSKFFSFGLAIVLAINVSAGQIKHENCQIVISDNLFSKENARRQREILREKGYHLLSSVHDIVNSLKVIEINKSYWQIVWLEKSPQCTTCISCRALLLWEGELEKLPFCIKGPSGQASFSNDSLDNDDGCDSD